MAVDFEFVGFDKGKVHGCIVVNSGLLWSRGIVSRNEALVNSQGVSPWFAVTKSPILRFLNREAPASRPGTYSHTMLPARNKPQALTHDHKTNRCRRTVTMTRILPFRSKILCLIAMASCSAPAFLACASDAAVAPQVADADAIAAARTASGNFAVDLYRQLAHEQPSKNLFLSPSSVSSALTLVGSGAVGETADEMGRVLRFPDSVRTSDPDRAVHPWNSAIIDRGQAALNPQSNQTNVPQAVRDRIASLRAELAAANSQTERS
jgi:Serpin (serine protease inhibitor)